MNRYLYKLTALFTIFTFATFSSAFAATQASITQGNITVIKDGKETSKLTGQNVVEDDTLMVCEGICTVKSQGINLVANDQSGFAVKNDGDHFNLFVQKGQIEFVISSGINKLSFYSPDGLYTVAEIIPDSNPDSVVRGYMLTNDKGTDIGVREGNLSFLSADGTKVVNAGNGLHLTAPESLPDGFTVAETSSDHFRAGQGSSQSELLAATGYAASVITLLSVYQEKKGNSTTGN